MREGDKEKQNCYRESKREIEQEMEKGSRDMREVHEQRLWERHQKRERGNEAIKWQHLK